MANPFVKAYRYLAAKTDDTLERNKDPKIEIQMAADDAKRRHRDLEASAASIIGTHRQLALSLDRERNQVESLQAQTRTALNQADAATTDEDRLKFNQNAEALASQLVSTEARVEELAVQVSAAGDAAEEDKWRVNASRAQLEVLNQQIAQMNMQVDAVRMQEQTNKSIDSLTSPFNDGSTPTLGEIEAKIQGRYALATGQVEVAGVNNAATSPVAAQHAIQNAQAASRLATIRQEMQSAPAVTAGAFTEPVVDSDMLKRLR